MTEAPAATAAFRLDVGTSGLATLSFDLPGQRVNLFTRKALEELREVVEDLARRQDIGCLLFLSAKAGSFCHGVDVDLLAGLDDVQEARAGATAGQQLFAAWSALPFPTVAAIHATCIGGGTELALASTYRLVADRPDLRIGLSEVRLGILPAWGGCVRLPRLIGIEEALGIILPGRSISPQKALDLGLADKLLPSATFLHHVREFGLNRLREPRPHPADHHLREVLLEKNPLGRRLLFDQARRRTLQRSRGWYPAPTRAIEVIRLGIEKGPAAGFEAEARALGELAVHPVTKNLIHVFRLSQAAKKDPPRPAPAKVERSGVAGAGVMGAAIAHLIAAKAEIPVRLLDRRAEALEKALAMSASLNQNRIKRRRMTPAQARHLLARIQPTLSSSHLGRCDLVVEAIDEDLEAKRRLLQELGERLPAEAVLASDTSSLSVTALAKGVTEPQRVVGLHFFNPVLRVPLVEVIATPQTSQEALATAIAFVRRLDKVPLEVNDRPGFLVNRLLGHFLTESLWLLAEGLSPERIDRALSEWGWPVGPFAMLDRIGIDVALTVAETLQRAFPDRLALPSWNWRRAFLEPGHLGEKSGAGFFRYEEGRPKGVDPEALVRLEVPAAGRGKLDATEIADRILLPMVDEAARCLEESLVPGPEQVDLGLVLAAGFPPFRGGLCRWADHQGLAAIVNTLDRLAGSAAERMAPSDALRRLADRGDFYSS
ncbi:MAG: enoyl-CoA hydratase/isomerase family protein [Acidobacteria bacterium]|nr:enoyl-CoA hydratase/isomerase family protein [Acidobacteriota bacterium]